MGMAERALKLLLRASGAVCMLAVVAAGMPWHWTVQEGPYVLIFSAAILLLLRRAVKEQPA